MRRREFITLLGGVAAVWPLASQGQQPAVPTVAWLTTGSRDSDAPRLAGFRAGLGEAGYVEGRNVTLDYRWTDGKYDQLPVLATNLVNSRVAVIAAIGTPPALAAKAATATIPIAFSVGGDPVKLGLVASLNRPGGNLTGLANLLAELTAKRLELLHELVPATRTIALLVNPTNAYSQSEVAEAQKAAASLSVQLRVLQASSANEVDAALSSLAGVSGTALVVGLDPFLSDRGGQIASLTTRLAIPAIAGYRAFVAAGGLASYAPNLHDMYRKLGMYVGKILNGAKPADLPVEQSVKIDLVINGQVAKQLGLDVPLKLLAFADEVIE